MSKKIKIKIKDWDKLEFFLEEDAMKNDFFSIKDINNYDLNEIKEHIEPMIKEIENKIRDDIFIKEQKNWENDFKNNNTEYKELVLLKINFDNEKKLLFEKKDNEINLLKNKFESDKEIFKKNIEIEKKNFENDLYKKNEEEKKNLEKIINEKEQELKSRENRNIKIIGEEFEEWVQNEFDDYFGMDDSVELRKTTVPIGGTKPDFEFIIKNDDGGKLDSVTIEVKTSFRDGGKTKNSDHYDKLEKDRKGLNSEYALLVSELEPNSTFLIKRPDSNKYKNMFVIRPAYLMHFLSLIKYISLEKKSIKTIEMNFKDKKDILDDFEDMKNTILLNSIKSINEKCASIQKEANNIRSSINKIDDSVNIILNSHLNTVKNKIENFKINNVCSKIEKIKK